MLTANSRRHRAADTEVEMYGDVPVPPPPIQPKRDPDRSVMLVCICIAAGMAAWFLIARLA